MSDAPIIPVDDIREWIYTIRGVQVMLDSDLARLYGVETKVLNQAVKRNPGRFPEEFCFQVTYSEFEILKSQFVTSSWGGRRTKPYAFTEQGVAMLSAVLRSETAIRMSVQIINAFVEMRRFLSLNSEIFRRLGTLEMKQLETDTKIGRVLDAIEKNEVRPKQGIFYDGQIFDAYKFVSDLFRSAKESIVIIDNYIDDSVLVHLTKRQDNVRVRISTRKVSESLAMDVEKFNSQYPPLEIKEIENLHDRFIVIDGKEIWHFGASLKDLGKKVFAFSKREMGAMRVLARLGGEGMSENTDYTECFLAYPGILDFRGGVKNGLAC